MRGAQAKQADGRGHPICDNRGLAADGRRGRAPEGLALACAAHLTCLGLPVAALAEASRLPTFVAAVTRWKLVIEQEGIEGALARD